MEKIVWDPFKELNVRQINIFNEMLEQNNITYEILDTPVASINNIDYEARSLKYKNFKDFVDELNENCVAEIYLFKVTTEPDTNTGELFYNIRYCINKDLIKNKTLKSIKKVINTIKTNKNTAGISPDKIKRVLSKSGISEEASRNIVKLIRIIEKELSKEVEGEIYGN